MLYICTYGPMYLLVLHKDVQYIHPFSISFTNTSPHVTYLLMDIHLTMLHMCMHPLKLNMYVHTVRLIMLHTYGRCMHLPLLHNYIQCTYIIVHLSMLQYVRTYSTALRVMYEYICTYTSSCYIRI